MEAVPIKREKKLPMPVVSAALGMAVAYYSYPYISSLSASPSSAHYFLLGLFFLLVVAICFIRALRFLPGINVRPVSKTGILAAALAVGFVLGTASRRNVPVSADLGLEAEKITSLSGILREDPRTLQGGSGFGILALRESGGGRGLRASAKGSVMVFFPSESIPRLKEFGRGAEIFIDGKLSLSERGLMFNASSVHVVKPASGLEQFRTSLRMTLLEKFRSRQDGKYAAGKAPVWGALASALLLGMRDDLDVDLSEGFRNSGCAHILALSGMHLAILSGVLAFLIRRPLGIRGASFAGAIFVILYVFIAGSQPSLVRSAIMYLIGTVSLWGFLKAKPFSLLCMAFIIQIVFQSETGMTLSFILSYLALAGILTLGNTFHAIFRGRLPGIVSGSLSASLGAFIITAPVVVLCFGSLWPIGIVVGLLIAPLSALFMVLALIALIVSFLPIPVWFVMDFLLVQVYRFMEFLVMLGGRVPGFGFSNPVPVLIVSILLWLIVLCIEKKDYLHRTSVASLG